MESHVVVGGVGELLATFLYQFCRIRKSTPPSRFNISILELLADYVAEPVPHALRQSRLLEGLCTFTLRAHMQ